MKINNNIMANNTTRQLNINSDNAAKSMEKLSSGYRINRAGDDAAGLAISEKMRGQIRGLNQASSNSQEGISLLQTAEGALSQTHDILQRMRELAVQASTGTLTDDDRGQIDKEFQALKSEVNDISKNTQFNKMNLLDGTFGAQVGAASGIKVETFTSTGAHSGGIAGVQSISLNGTAADTYTITDDGTDLTITSDNDSTVTQKITGGTMTAGVNTVTFDKLGITITTNAAGKDATGAAVPGFAAAGLNGLKLTVAGGSVDLQTGANQGETLSIDIADMSANGLGIAGNNTLSNTAASASITSLENAIKKVSDERAKLGATQNRLEYKIKNLDSSSENLTSAESQIRDVDMASEMVNYTKNDILQQAAQAMLAKANQAPQSVLQLLR